MFAFYSFRFVVIERQTVVCTVYSIFVWFGWVISIYVCPVDTVQAAKIKNPACALTTEKTISSFRSFSHSVGVFCLDRDQELVRIKDLVWTNNRFHSYLKCKFLFSLVVCLFSAKQFFFLHLLCRNGHSTYTYTMSV